MLSCALIGPDGAGKTTVCRRLERELGELGLPAEYIYMGVSKGSSNRMLPTTRLLARLPGARADRTGPRDHASARQPASGRGGPLRALKATLGLCNRVAEEWFRQALSWRHRRHGKIVLFDRHFYADYYAYDIAGPRAGLSLARKLHGWMLEHLFPRPDLVVYLDAPADVLLARKGEGNCDLLERRRRDYLEVGKRFADFVVVDATQSADRVVAEVANHIRTRCRSACPEQEAEHVPTRI